MNARTTPPANSAKGAAKNAAMMVIASMLVMRFDACNRVLVNNHVPVGCVLDDA